MLCGNSRPELGSDPEKTPFYEGENRRHLVKNASRLPPGALAGPWLGGSEMPVRRDAHMARPFLHISVSVSGPGRSTAGDNDIDVFGATATRKVAEGADVDLGLHPEVDQVRPN